MNPEENRGSSESKSDPVFKDRGKTAPSVFIKQKLERKPTKKDVAKAKRGLRRIINAIFEVQNAIVPLNDIAWHHDVNRLLSSKEELERIKDGVRAGAEYWDEMLQHEASPSG